MKEIQPLTHIKFQTIAMSQLRIHVRVYLIRTTRHRISPFYRTIKAFIESSQTNLVAL